MARPLNKELFLQLPLETPLLAQYCDHEHSRTLSLLSFLYFFLCAQIRLSVLSKYICVVWDRVEAPGVLVGSGFWIFWSDPDFGVLVGSRFERF